MQAKNGCRSIRERKEHQKQTFNSPDVLDVTKPPISEDSSDSNKQAVTAAQRQTFNLLSLPISSWHSSFPIALLALLLAIFLHGFVQQRSFTPFPFSDSKHRFTSIEAMNYHLRVGPGPTMVLSRSD
jgi:hypothetical protein